MKKNDGHIGFALAPKTQGCKMAAMLPVTPDCSLLSSPCTASSSDSKRENAEMGTWPSIRKKEESKPGEPASRTEL